MKTALLTVGMHMMQQGIEAEWDISHCDTRSKATTLADRSYSSGKPVFLMRRAAVPVGEFVIAEGRH